MKCLKIVVLENPLKNIRKYLLNPKIPKSINKQWIDTTSQYSIRMVKQLEMELS